METFTTTSSDVRVIVVTGTGTASDTADRVTLTLGVLSENKSASQAGKENAELMVKVLDNVKAHGIQEKDIQTVTYRIHPNFNRNSKRTTSYRVTNMIRLSLDDLNMVGEVLDTTTDAGANQVQGISFGLSDEKNESLKNQAYRGALDQAKKKANLIAETYKLTLTGVKHVQESSYKPYRERSVSMNIRSEGSPTPIHEGSLSVSVSIQVAFTFE